MSRSPAPAKQSVGTAMLFAASRWSALSLPNQRRRQFHLNHWFTMPRKSSSGPRPSRRRRAGPARLLISMMRVALTFPRSVAAASVAWLARVTRARTISRASGFRAMYIKNTRPPLSATRKLAPFPWPEVPPEGSFLHDAFASIPVSRAEPRPSRGEGPTSAVAGFSPRLSHRRARYPKDVGPEPSSASSGNALARSGRRRTRRGRVAPSPCDNELTRHTSDALFYRCAETKGRHLL